MSSPTGRARGRRGPVRSMSGVRTRWPAAGWPGLRRPGSRSRLRAPCRRRRPSQTSPDEPDHHGSAAARLVVRLGRSPLVGHACGLLRGVLAGLRAVRHPAGLNHDPTRSSPRPSRSMMPPPAGAPSCRASTARSTVRSGASPTRVNTVPPDAQTTVRGTSSLQPDPVPAHRRAPVAVEALAVQAARAAGTPTPWRCRRRS